MATSIEQAMQEQKAPPAAPAVIARAETHVHLPPAAANTNSIVANSNDRPGTDPMDFVRANRIHIQHGSLFIDPYLVIHPRELDPKNEAQLRAKMQLTYSINNPSFYEAPERVSIALNLGQLVPVSLNSKRSKLMDEVQKFNSQVDTGADATLQQQADDKHSPFTAIVRDTVENPEVDPVGLEVLKNGLSIYLLMRERLTRNHFFGQLTDYVERSGTPDQVLHDLSSKIGVSPRQVREAALQGGIDGVGKLLGLEPNYIADVKRLTEHAATQDFGYNLVEHWHLGRQLLGIDAPLEQKLATGMEARITNKIGEYRGRVRHFYDVPEAIQKEEARIAERLMLVEPIQRQLMFEQGYEICYTPENTADAIAFHKGVYGLHRRAANDLTSFDSTNRIFVAGHGSLEKSAGTQCHEIAHVLWLNYFSPEETKRIDDLAASDASGFTQLQHLLDEKFTEFETLHRAYLAGNPQEKKAVLETANQRFANYGINVDELFPYLNDAQSFRFMVWDANDVLQVEGGRYNRSGYDTPQERFREVISRFAEMRQASQRDNPNVLRYLAPGLTEIWEKHYIPHLERVYQDLVAYKQGGTRVAGVNAAIGTNASTITRPANNNETVDEQPKVEEHVRQQGTPVKPAAAAADAVESSPRNQISQIHYNAQTLAARDAMKGMGISTSSLE